MIRGPGLDRLSGCGFATTGIGIRDAGLVGFWPRDAFLGDIPIPRPKGSRWVQMGPQGSTWHEPDPWTHPGPAPTPAPLDIRSTVYSSPAPPTGPGRGANVRAASYFFPFNLSGAGYALAISVSSLS
jgi:hypothetical protein